MCREKASEMDIVRAARAAISAAQRFLVLGNTADRFRIAGRLALSYRVLHCRNVANGCLRQSTRRLG